MPSRFMRIWDCLWYVLIFGTNVQADDEDSSRAGRKVKKTLVSNRVVLVVFGKMNTYRQVKLNEEL